MNITDIIMANMIIYITISLIALIVGYITGKSRTIGYILMACILLFCIVTIISGVHTAVTNDVSIWQDAQPSILIGSFVGGWTSYYWYDAGKWMAK